MINMNIPAVNQALIDAAEANLKTKLEGLAAAVAALAPLQSHANAASEAAEAAIASADYDAHALAEAAHLASRRLQTGVRIRDAALQAVAQARDGVAEATALASEPIRAHGLLMIYQSSVAHDAALAALQAAEDARAEGCRIVMSAHTSGLLSQSLLLDINGHIQMNAELRRSYMTGNGINLETGKVGA